MTTQKGKYKLIDPNALKHATASDKEVLIVYNQKVYDLTRFLVQHPGGQTAILRQNGKDSTDAIEAFHPYMDIEKRIACYCVGEISTVGGDDFIETDSAISSASSNLTSSPSTGLDTGAILQSYMQLHDRLKKEGFYEPQVWVYVKQLMFFAILLAFAVGLAVWKSNETVPLIASAFLLGVVWHGLSFIVHDAGHHSVFCDRKKDDLLGCVVASFVGGLSVQWWTLNHNIHHIITNDPEHDPDIQHLPVLAVSTRFFDDLYSTFHKRVMKFDATARFMVQIQHYMYYPVMSFGRFNLYAQSINHLLNFKHPDSKKYRWLELAGMAFFWTWFGYGLLGCVVQGFWHKVMFLYVSHAATMILHVQITLSHFAMSTECEEDELFAVKAVRTTMNVDCPEWFDWFHGGLQFQIEHHLYPRVPRPHFRKLQVYVRDFCSRHGLVYHCDDFFKSNLIVLDSLRVIAKEAGLLKSKIV